MTRNMGVLDRALRVFVVVPVAVVLAFNLGTASILGVILLVVAGVMLATSVVGYCPTYVLIGISTEHGPHRVGHGVSHGHA